MERTIHYREDFALEMFSSKAYLAVNKKLIKKYGPEVAVYLSNLIDRYKYFLETDQLRDGVWFYSKNEQQMEATGLTESKLKKCKAILKEDKILVTRLFGIPGNMYYALNMNLLLRRIIPLSRGSRKSLNKPSDFQQNLLYNKITQTGCDKISTYLPQAQRLSKIIQYKKNITHQLPQIKTWAKEITRLIRENKVTIERVDKALDWYEFNIGGEYVPVIESGSSFRTKFINLEAAIDRSKSPYKSSNLPKFKYNDNGVKYYLNEKNGHYYTKSGRLFID